MDERLIFTEQLIKPKKESNEEKDLFIFDCGYFSSHLIEIIVTSNNNYIYRLSKNLIVVKHLEKHNINDYQIVINGKI